MFSTRLHLQEPVTIILTKFGKRIFKFVDFRKRDNNALDIGHTFITYTVCIRSLVEGVA